MMKTLGIAGFLLVMIWACSPQKQIVKIKPTTVPAKDSTEYELIVLDPPFETWFVLNSGPTRDHSNEYYRSWNSQYVAEWNYHYNSGHKPRIFENYIDYDNTIDYGIELNRKLYYYFRYVEIVLKVPILQSGRRPEII
jgi:hypothetical protein